MKCTNVRTPAGALFFKVVKTGSGPMIEVKSSKGIERIPVKSLIALLNNLI